MTERESRDQGALVGKLPDEILEHLAASRGVRELYKFRAFTTDEDLERVRQIVVDGRVYFPLKRELNDPFDLTPRLVLGGSLEDPEFVQRLKGRAREVLVRQSAPAAAVDKRLRAMTNDELEEQTIRGAALAVENIAKNYPIFSMAGNRTAPLLWSHYGDGHRGLCIHFSTAEPSIFGIAQEVHYAEARSEIPIPIELSELEVHRRALLWKGYQWAYEEEFRLVQYPNGFGANLIDFRGRFLHFPLECISGVSLGIEMPRNKQQVVLAWATQRKPPIPVWIARVGDDFQPVFRALNLAAAEQDAVALAHRS